MQHNILIGLLVLLVAYLVYSNHVDQQARLQEQQQLQQSLAQFQHSVEQQKADALNRQEALLEQEAELLKQQQAVIQQTRSQSAQLEEQLAASEQQSQQLEMRLQESAEQTEVLNEQLNTLDLVVEDLAEKQHQEAQLRKEYEAMAEQALQGSYRARGLQTASMIKTMVAEFYLTEGRFPRSNTILGLQQPTAYANEQVKSITVGKGGRITIVYTALSGKDNGAINLTPKIKNGQLEWRCSSWDFEDIRDTMPSCFYGG